MFLDREEERMEIIRSVWSRDLGGALLGRISPSSLTSKDRQGEKCLQTYFIHMVEGEPSCHINTFCEQL